MRLGTCRKCGLDIRNYPVPSELCVTCAGPRRYQSAVATALLAEVDRLVPLVGTGPTRARPGSAEKIAVLANRAALMLPLWVDPKGGDD